MALSNSAIITIDGDGVIQSVDKSGCMLFGYGLTDLLGEKVNKLVPTPYKEQHDAYLSRYHRTGVKRIIGKTRLVEGQRQDGSVFPMRLSVTEVALPDKKLFIGMVAKIEPISALVAADISGRIISFNEAAEHLWLCSADQVVGHMLPTLFASSSSSSALESEGDRVYVNSVIDNLVHQRRQWNEGTTGCVVNCVAAKKNGNTVEVSVQIHVIDTGTVQFIKMRAVPLDSELEGVLTIDAHGRILGCSRTSLKPLFGCSSFDELRMLNVRDVVSNFGWDSVLASARVYNAQVKALGHYQQEPGSSSSLASSGSSSGEDEQTITSSESTIDDNAAAEEQHRAKRQRVLDFQTSVLQSDSMLLLQRASISLDTLMAFTHICHRDSSRSPARVEMTPFLDAADGCCQFSVVMQRMESLPPDEERIVVDQQAALSSPSSSSSSSSPLPSRKRTRDEHAVDGDDNDDNDVVTKGKEDVDGREEEEYAPSNDAPSSSSSSEAIGTELSKIGDYVVLRAIGKGSSGAVVLAEHEQTKQQVAIKVQQKDLMNDKELDRFRLETAIMTKLLHENVCRLFEVIETDEHYCIVMEYCNGGELFSYIMKHGAMSEQTARGVFRQIAAALQYCHERQVVHRDVKHKSMVTNPKRSKRLGASEY
jgi:PAS domain S-box-containing protein